MDRDTYVSTSNLTYYELRSAVLEALCAERDGVGDQSRLDELLAEIERRIIDGDGLIRFLDQLRRSNLVTQSGRAWVGPGHVSDRSTDGTSSSSLR